VPLSIRRPQHLSGVIGVALVGIALALPGPPPKASDSAVALRATLVEHRAAFVSGLLVAGLGFAALIWFVGCVASAVRESDAPASPRPAIVLGGGLAATVLIFVGMVSFAGAAFRTAGLGDQFVVRAAVDTGNMLIEASKFGFAVLIVAMCTGQALSFLSSRFRTVGLVAAAAVVLSAIPPFVVDHGPGQFGGSIDLVGTVPALLWLAVLSISLAKADGPRGRDSVRLNVSA
jgi:hypothetical protein